MKLLIINICKNELHYNEFVRPIDDISKQITNDITIIDYKDLDVVIIEKFDKIIIGGTAIKDFDYMENLDKFFWINSTNKSILGICGGAQIIANIFGSKLKKGIEIGMQTLEILEDDKLFENINLSQIYCLHNNYFDVPKNFKLIAKSTYPQIIKHNNKNIYGVLFHPEARNKDLIINFLKL